MLYYVNLLNTFKLLYYCESRRCYYHRTFVFSYWGKFFLIRGAWYYTYCDKPLVDEPNKTCRDVGSKRRYDDKCKNDPIWQTYNRAYKAHYARYMKKKMTIAQFEAWSRFASEIRDRALARGYRLSSIMPILGNKKAESALCRLSYFFVLCGAIFETNNSTES